jgi:hypothetical protein
LSWEDGKDLGIFGFGAAGHIAPVARWQGRPAKAAAAGHMYWSSPVLRTAFPPLSGTRLATRDRPPLKRHLRDST